ncbi:tetratricopeptide repeat protein [Christiangramia sp. SM2212]|uniref:Tetratricopeptide repeat protein n=1 Tax=Christiangramia sediminicola TaxID=3073267 RepID=A0ABU1ELP7_9FLAO|nr:tetratricopeptide repeat protein [Christiangramia sp. SM2212]MDR5589259.1 hypothetical protein [Christiangramia sp. SM2212]
MKIRFLIILVLGCSLTVSSQEETIKAADSLFSFGKRSEAIELLEKTEPKSEKVFLKLAKLQQANSQNEDALMNYKKVFEKNPDRILTTIDYGELLLETGKAVEADSLFSNLSEKYPDNPGFLYRIGLAKEKKKDSVAIKYFYKTLSKEITHQGALYKVAKNHLQNGKSYNAITYCNEGLAVRPNNVSLLSILGQSYSRSLQFEKSIEPYEKLIELGESSEFILEKLAKSYRVTGQDDKAIETYEKMLEINEYNSGVHSNLGALYFQKNEMEKAQDHFSKALMIKDQPVDREYLNLGLIQKDKEKFKEALQFFENAIKENPENERAILERAIAADAYFEDKEAVLNLYESYLEKFGENGRNDMLSVARYRVSELKSEIHQAK